MVATTLLFAAASPAEAADCSRWSCVGQDPDAADCSSNWTMLTRSFAGENIQIRASGSCKAMWVRSLSNELHNTAFAQVWAAWNSSDLDTRNMGDALRTGRAQLSSTQLLDSTSWGYMVYNQWLRLCGNYVWFTAVPDWRNCQPLRSLSYNPYFSSGPQ